MSLQKFSLTFRICKSTPTIESKHHTAHNQIHLHCNFTFACANTSTPASPWPLECGVGEGESLSVSVHHYISSEPSTVFWSSTSLMKVKVLVAQLCLTLGDPMDCSLPDSSVHRILQARILEWVAMPFSRRSSQSRDRTRVSKLYIMGSRSKWRCFRSHHSQPPKYLCSHFSVCTLRLHAG